MEACHSPLLSLFSPQPVFVLFFPTPAANRQTARTSDAAQPERVSHRPGPLHSGEVVAECVCKLSLTGSLPPERSDTDVKRSSLESQPGHKAMSDCCLPVPSFWAIALLYGQGQLPQALFCRVGRPIPAERRCRVITMQRETVTLNAREPHTGSPVCSWELARRLSLWG